MKRRQKQRRPKGEGSLQRLPNGRYKMTITIGAGEDGRQRRKSVTANTRQELLDKTAELRLQYHMLSERERQTLLDHKTYRDISEEWYRANGRLATNTLVQYRKVDKNYIYPYIGHLQAGGITGDVCDALFIACRDKGLSDNTLNAVRQRLRMIFNYMKKRKLISDNPLTYSAFTFSGDSDQTKARFILRQKAR